MSNPGHDIEARVVPAGYAKQFGKPELIEKAQTIFDNAIRRLGQRKTADFSYFVDAKGLPRLNLMSTI